MCHLGVSTSARLMPDHRPQTRPTGVGSVALAAERRDKLGPLVSSFLVVFSPFEFNLPLLCTSSSSSSFVLPYSFLFPSGTLGYMLVLEPPRGLPVHGCRQSWVDGQEAGKYGLAGPEAG